jgi:hypothetical protein
MLEKEFKPGKIILKHPRPDTQNLAIFRPAASTATFRGTANTITAVSLFL